MNATPKTIKNIRSSLQSTPVRFIALGLGWVLIAILFSLSYTQTPLYEGNQNTKFLHGLAQAGRGYLAYDWLANTVDPLPVFSTLVNVTARIGESLFYVYYGVLLGIYIFSLYGIANSLFQLRQSWTKTILFLGLFFTAHSAWLMYEMQKQHRLDMSFLHFGLAGQYLLGLEFQNSSFGVLLLFSIYLFLNNKNVWAILALGVACLFHPAYLFSAALIVLAYTGIIFFSSVWRDKETKLPKIPDLLNAARKPFLLGVLALALVLPVVLYNQIYLGATSPEISAQAMDILVHYRIPHHSLPAVWFNNYSIIQIGMMVVGLILARKSRLFWIMASLSAGGLLLSIVQILTQSNELAYLAPWRVSVLLVPISLTMLIAYLISLTVDWTPLPKSLILGLAIIAFSYLIYQSVAVGQERSATYRSSARQEHFFNMMDHVRQTMQPDDLYLIPAEDGRFNEFRIHSGAPTFINWKSHPYKDIEVLEWYRRVELANSFYSGDWGSACTTLNDILKEYPITHVIFFRMKDQLTCDFVSEEFRNNQYTIYQVSQQP
jgi:hypothetical protein